MVLIMGLFWVTSDPINLNSNARNIQRSTQKLHTIFTHCFAFFRQYKFTKQLLMYKLKLCPFFMSGVSGTNFIFMQLLVKKTITKQKK